ncbi:unnamed protein product [Symbiodinium natans]|uniref:PSI domain-containing protein n=1 Tax=Symbiodinium natans TaxID=878477 RepID=A0A812PQG4_9DINO|nr:unnamed protein product [Symbiodinium natans]
MAIGRWQRTGLLLGLWANGALAKMVMGIADGEDYQLAREPRSTMVLPDSQAMTLLESGGAMSSFLPSIICGVISLGCLLAGIILTIMGGGTVADASGSVGESFESLGTVCTIATADHTFQSKRESQTAEAGAANDLVEFCEDRVAYTFTFDGSTLSERVQTSRRPSVTRDGVFDSFAPVEDRCQGAGGYDSDLVCESACRPGQQVPCWRAQGCSDCASELAWAKCANPACIKIIPPLAEQQQSQEEGDIIQLLGLFFFIIAGGSCCFTVGFTACAMRRS